jgi:hypothetical protein
MFESLTEASLLDLMRDAQRRERMATAERVLAAGRFALNRFEADEQTCRQQWYLDDVALVEAELGAELGISRGRAGAEIQRGIELIERFPKLAAVFAAGRVEYRLISAILFRTGLIHDEQIVAILDQELALLAPTWNAMSADKIKTLIDFRVRQLDPAAERVAPDNSGGRCLEVAARQDGLADVWGLVHGADGAALNARLDQLADSLCSNDPRTKDQRRADAVGALAAGATQLVCGCDGIDCTQQRSTSGSGVQVVITVIAEAATVSGTSQAPGLLPGYGAIPAPVVRQLAATAKIRTLPAPHNFTIEPQYRRSTALANFVRCRDLHCRFPGCTRPATLADIDHTVPWPSGPTHPSNCKLLCRIHHLVKTFEHGWRDEQLPDGTVTWTSPRGRTFTTKPGGALFFPQLASPTATLTIPTTTNPPKPGRTLAMPTRRQPRTVQHANRITYERTRNQTRLTLLGQPIPTPDQAILAYTKPF